MTEEERQSLLEGLKAKWEQVPLLSLFFSYNNKKGLGRLARHGKCGSVASNGLAPPGEHCLSGRHTRDKLGVGASFLTAAAGGTE